MEVDAGIKYLFKNYIPENMYWDGEFQMMKTVLMHLYWQGRREMTEGKEKGNSPGNMN